MTTAKEFVDCCSTLAFTRTSKKAGVRTTPPFSTWPITCLTLRAIKEQIEAELGGDLEIYIRASIDRQNVKKSVSAVRPICQG